jgi:hypothetical protein
VAEDTGAKPIGEPSAEPFTTAGRRQLDWVREKWGDDRACPYCRNTSWSVPDEIAEIRPFGPRLDSVAYPVFQVICQNCGNTVLINAVIADIPPT